MSKIAVAANSKNLFLFFYLCSGILIGFFSSNQTLLFYMSVQVAFRFDESTSFSNYSNFDIKLKINSPTFITFSVKTLKRTLLRSMLAIML